MRLRNLGILGLLFLIPAGKCTAQVRGDDYHGHGYAYVAPGGFTAGGSTNAALGLGVGGEAMLYKGLAAGADIGWQGPTQSFRNGIGLASFNGAYHFVSSQNERRLVPFVTAGYTRSFANQSGANLANYGAGIQYWLKRIGPFASRLATTSTPAVRRHMCGRSASPSFSAELFNRISPG